MRAHSIAGTVVALAISSAFGISACGGEGQGGVVPAGAFDRPKKDEGVAKLEAGRKEADAKAEARAAAQEAELRRLTDEVAIVPDPKPRSIEAACAAAAEAMDALVQRQFATDKAGLAEWNLDKPNMLADLKRKCVDEDTLDAAACKAHAMSHADDRLVGDAFGLMARCDEKFGKPAKADAKDAKR
jgi:hypothetical protein